MLINAENMCAYACFTRQIWQDRVAACTYIIRYIHTYTLMCMYAGDTYSGVCKGHVDIQGTVQGRSHIYSQRGAGGHHT